jgi:hypothetical protein
MSLVQSAKLNGHDPHAYIRDARAPSHPASRIEELMPHRWQPAEKPGHQTARAQAVKGGAASRLRVSGWASTLN